MIDKNAKEDKVVADQLGADITEPRRWAREIEGAKRDFKDYWDACDAITTKYKDGKDTARTNQRPEALKERRYNVLWSITQTLQPLIYGEPPRPFVNRRFKDSDPAARDASLLIQRSLEYDLEGDELHMALEAARDDLLLCGRGVIWAKYRPYMGLRQSSEKVYIQEGQTPPEGATVQSDEFGPYFYRQYEAKIDEEVDWEYVNYRNFLHGSASKWKHVPWVARCVYLTRQDLIARFGEEIGEKVPLSATGQKDSNRMHQDGPSEKTDDKKGLFDKAEVWEIWCKQDKKIRWLCPDWEKQFLDIRDDFLGLREFYPCPRPVFGTLTNETLIPQPDYRIWQGIAMELDEVTWRIKLLTEALRVVGIYDKSLGDVLKQVTQQTHDNDMIGVDGYAMLAEKGGLKGSIEFFPIEQVMGVLQNLYGARQQLLQELYDITGIADIMRGATDPRETAKAQQIKGNAANRRIKTRQNGFLRFVRQALEIHAQIMSSLYSDEQIRMIANADEIMVDPMTGQVNPQRFAEALQLMRSAPLRRFRVKVSEKTLATQDTMEDMQERNEYIQSITQMVGGFAPMMEQNAAMKPLLGEFLKFAVRGFPNSKTTEAGIEAAIEAMVQAPPPEPPPPPGPTPEELEIEKQRLAIEQQRVELDSQYKMREIAVREMETQIKAQEMQLQNQNRQTESMLRADKQAQDAEIAQQQVQATRDQAAAQVQSASIAAERKGEYDEYAKMAEIMEKKQKQDLEEKKLLLDAAYKGEQLDMQEQERLRREEVDMHMQQQDLMTKAWQTKQQVENRPTPKPGGNSNDS